MIDILKVSYNNYVDKLISTSYPFPYQSYQSNQSYQSDEIKIIQNKLVTVVIGHDLNSDSHFKTARQMGISIIDYAEYEKELITYLNNYSSSSNNSSNSNGRILRNQPLLMKKIDFDSKLNIMQFNKTNDLSDSVLYALYDPSNGFKINTTYGNDTKITISTIMKDRDIKSNVNSSNQDNLSNKTAYPSNMEFDPFDPNDKAFTSRCFISTNETSGYDTTINSRRKEYFNGTATCFTGNSSEVKCEYKGVDEHHYIRCVCTNIKLETEIMHSIGKDSLSIFPPVNLDIIGCTFFVIKEVYIIKYI